jgi:hypothetical protein
VLEETAKAGRFPDGTKGPWSWLGFQWIVGEAWLHPAFIKIAETVGAGPPSPTLLALLDWFFEERDLWRFFDLLQTWHSNPPVWSELPADMQPPGWERNLRSAHWSGVKTLGDVVRGALSRAKAQVVTPPISDLPMLFGNA